MLNGCLCAAIDSAGVDALAIAGVLAACGEAFAGSPNSAGEAAAIGVKIAGWLCTSGETAAIGTAVGLSAASGAGVAVASTAGGLGKGNTDETCAASGVFCLAISLPAITPKKNTTPERPSNPIRITKKPPALISNRILPPHIRSGALTPSNPSPAAIAVLSSPAKKSRAMLKSRSGPIIRFAGLL